MFNQMFVFVCSMFALSTMAQDPSGSWLSYAVYTQSASAKITMLNTTWKVPANPLQQSGSNAPGWWFGVQTANGRGALIQPILAWADGRPQWTIFNGVYDWNDHSWWSSKQQVVQPGDEITSSVYYDASHGTYYMYIAANGHGITSPKKEHAGQVESTAYFVLEHQPSSCKAYPPDGELTFQNIYIEVEGKPVVPKWEAKQERPACDSKAIITSPKEIKFTWSAKETEDTENIPNLVDDSDSFPRKWAEIRKDMRRNF